MTPRESAELGRLARRITADFMFMRAGVLCRDEEAFGRFVDRLEDAVGRLYELSREVRDA